MHGRKLASVATGRRHVFREVILETCDFDSVALAEPDFDLRKRPHEFRNIRATRCRFRNCLIQNALLQNVFFADCSAPEGGLVLWKCVLQEVVFEGVYETLRVIPPNDHSYAEPEIERLSTASPFVLDVRKARFSEVEILGIPPSLVRFDSTVGGVLSRDVLEDAGWPAFSVSEYFGGIMLKMKAYGGPASVYVVPTEAPQGPELLAELTTLRARGWVQ